MPKGSSAPDAKALSNYVAKTNQRKNLSLNIDFFNKIVDLCPVYSILAPTTDFR